MRLIDLNPKWIGAGGEGVTLADGSPAPERHGVGIVFDCPCGCGTRAMIEFTIATDGKPWRAGAWKRTGDTFDMLTLSPSIQRAEPDGCRWHGFIRDGKAVNA